eukprot:2157433-Heterocapsa_arctica.AAC.1
MSAEPPHDRALRVPADAGSLGMRVAASSGVVTKVESSSWADEAGVKAGDEIVEIDGAAPGDMDRI